jgi:hypothetical protein
MRLEEETSVAPGIRVGDNNYFFLDGNAFLV